MFILIGELKGNQVFLVGGRKVLGQYCPKAYRNSQKCALSSVPWEPSLERKVGKREAGPRTPGSGFGLHWWKGVYGRLFKERLPRCFRKMVYKLK